MINAINYNEMTTCKVEKQKTSRLLTAHSTDKI